jgi:transcriptional regulator with XRE-family HTH domain
MPRLRDEILDHCIGRNIQRFRVRKGMSQAALGAPLGLTFQQIQKYEHGANRVPASRLFHIACILQVPVAALFDSTGHTHHPSWMTSTEVGRLTAAFEGIANS